MSEASEIHVEKPHLGSAPDSEVAEYQSVSVLAVAGLLVGLAAWLAMLAPLLWFVPWAGIALNIMALRQIAQYAPALVGRKAAMAGLLLSVGFAVAAPTDWYAYRWIVRREAAQFATAWFEFLAEDQPHQAHQLTQAPSGRQPLDDSLKNFYPDNSEMRQQLKEYVARPLINTLLTFGPRAEVRYFDTEAQWTESDRDLVQQTFAVRFDEDGQTKTFFVGMILERSRLPSTGQAYWRLSRSEGGIRPTALGGSAAKPE